MTTKSVVVFRVDGGAHLGMGHLKKTKILVRHLKSSLIRPKILIFIKEDKKGIAWLKKQGLTVIVIPKRLSKAEEPLFISKKVSFSDKVVCVLDILKVSKSYIRQLKHFSFSVITLENSSDSKFEANFTSNTLVEGISSKSIKKGSSVVDLGPKYRVFHPDYPKYLKRKRKISKKSSILVSLGGGSDLGFSGILLDAIRTFCVNIEVYFVLGPSQTSIRNRWSGLKNLKIHLLEPQESLAPYLYKVDLALVAGGGTLYECALMGVPALAFAKVKHQEKNIIEFKKKGSALYMGRMNHANAVKGARQVSRLFENRKQLSQISSLGKKGLDARGTERLIKKIEFLLKRR